MLVLPNSSRMGTPCLMGVSSRQRDVVLGCGVSLYN